MALILAGTLMSVSLSAHAQAVRDEPTGHLRGTVADPTGAVVPGAKVLFKSNVANYSVTTAANGTYDTQLPVGTYGIDVRKPGLCYQRAQFRLLASAPLTINAVVTACAIADVVTLENGKGTARDEIRPAYRAESVLIPDSSTQPLEMLITYASREEDADVTTYTGNGAPEVVATYDNLTVYARRVRFDRKALRIYAEGSVVVEDGTGRSTGERAALAFEQGKATVEVK
jgi:Carboxypeptidase regulatory-like domain